MVTVLVTIFWHFSACKNCPYSVFDIFDVLSVCKISRFVGISLILHELHSPWLPLEEAQLNPAWLYLPSGPLFTLISQLTIRASGHCSDLSLLSIFSTTGCFCIQGFAFLQKINLGIYLELFVTVFISKG